MHDYFGIDVSATDNVVLASFILQVRLRPQLVSMVAVEMVTSFESVQLRSIIECSQRCVCNRILLRLEMHNILSNSFD